MTDSTNADPQRTTPGGVTDWLSSPEAYLHFRMVELFGPLFQSDDTKPFGPKFYRSIGPSLLAGLEKHFSLRATPARSSLPPDFGKLIQEIGEEQLIELIVESGAFQSAFFRAAYNCADAQDEYVARCDLVRAIAASLGPPSGDLERAAQLAEGRATFAENSGYPHESLVVAHLRFLAADIRALASPGEKEGTP